MDPNIFLYLAILFALPPMYALGTIGQAKFHKYAIKGLKMNDLRMGRIQ